MALPVRAASHSHNVIMIILLIHNKTLAICKHSPSYNSYLITVRTVFSCLATYNNSGLSTTQKDFRG